MNAVLSTSAPGQIPGVQKGSHRLVIKFGSNGSTRWITYEKADQPGNGIKMEVPAGSEAIEPRVLNLATGEQVRELQAHLFNSVFTVEDIAMDFLTWSNQKLLGEETLKDRKCWKILSTANPSQGSAYSGVQSWIDQEYGAVLEAKAYEEDRLSRHFRVRSFQQLDNTWLLKKLELDAPLLKAKSRLEILEAKKVE
jgi:hypothetical protein